MDRDESARPSVAVLVIGSNEDLTAGKVIVRATLKKVGSKLIVSSSPLLFAASIAARRLPAPLSFTLVTVKVAPAAPRVDKMRTKRLQNAVRRRECSGFWFAAIVVICMSTKSAKRGEKGPEKFLRLEIPLGPLGNLLAEISVQCLK